VGTARDERAFAHPTSDRTGGGAELVAPTFATRYLAEQPLRVNRVGSGRRRSLTNIGIGPKADPTWTMSVAEQKCHDICKDQWAAARSVRARRGILSALDYLIGEKLLIYAETAATRPEFARQLPRFVAEVRHIFSGEEAQELPGSSRAHGGDDDFLGDSPDQRAAKRARLARLKDLLTLPVLGTA
jgi:hypothetical protein